MRRPEKRLRSPLISSSELAAHLGDPAWFVADCRFELGKPEAGRAAFVDALELFGIGYSWGGFESLVIPFDPADIRSATPWPPETWNSEDRLGIRLSIGLEDPRDLIEDLTRGFAAMENA